MSRQRRRRCTPTHCDQTETRSCCLKPCASNEIRPSCSSWSVGVVRAQMASPLVSSLSKIPSKMANVITNRRKWFRISVQKSYQRPVPRSGWTIAVGSRPSPAGPKLISRLPDFATVRTRRWTRPVVFVEVQHASASACVTACDTGLPASQAARVREQTCQPDCGPLRCLSPMSI